MSLRPDNTLISNREMLTELVLMPFRAFAQMIERLAETNSRTQAVQTVNAIPEAELRAKGLTRTEAMSIILHHDA